MRIRHEKDIKAFENLPVRIGIHKEAAVANSWRSYGSWLHIRREHYSKLYKLGRALKGRHVNMLIYKVKEIIPKYMDVIDVVKDIVDHPNRDGGYVSNYGRPSYTIDEDRGYTIVDENRIIQHKPYKSWKSRTKYTPKESWYKLRLRNRQRNEARRSIKRANNIKQKLINTWSKDFIGFTITGYTKEQRQQYFNELSEASQLRLLNPPKRPDHRRDPKTKRFLSYDWWLKPQQFENRNIDNYNDDEYTSIKETKRRGSSIKT